MYHVKREKLITRCFFPLQMMTAPDAVRGNIRREVQRARGKSPESRLLSGTEQAPRGRE